MESRKKAQKAQEMIFGSLMFSVGGGNRSHASRSEALTVAVGFSPRIGAAESFRRGATNESTTQFDAAFKRRYATPPAGARSVG